MICKCTRDTNKHLRINIIVGDRRTSTRYLYWMPARNCLPAHLRSILILTKYIWIDNDNNVCGACHGHHTPAQPLSHHSSIWTVNMPYECQHTNNANDSKCFAADIDGIAFVHITLKWLIAFCGKTKPKLRFLNHEHNAIEQY